MNRRHYFFWVYTFALSLCADLLAGENASASSAVAPSTPTLLHHNKKSPRYFVDASGKTVLLIGSHAWLSQQDFSTLPPFDYPAYLDILTSHGHNFIRLWQLDRPYMTLGPASTTGVPSPLPFARTGPGSAEDGQPKFDLGVFDQTYFDRLRERVIAAGARGIYVSVMLFDGWWINGAATAADFRYSYFNPANNVNGLTMTKTDIYTMNNAAWVALMDRYVNKVIDTVGDLDNVLYEVINEAPGSSKSFQYHIISQIHSYESNRPKRHPVGMTAYDGLTSDDVSNADMLASSADWFSPSGRTPLTYTTNVVAASGTKVSILDTDHIWGLDPAGDDSPWVWKSLTRGHNPIYMDPLHYAPANPPDTKVRAALGHACALAQRINLKAMVPNNALASTGYVLADPDFEYLVYQPASTAVTVNLPARVFNYEWINPHSGSVTESGTFTATAGNRSFNLPSGYTSGLLYLKIRGPHLTRIGRLTNGHLFLQGHGDGNATYFLESTLDPNNGFTASTSITADAAGIFTYVDSDSRTVARKFYRVLYR